MKTKPIAVIAYLPPDLAQWIKEQAAATTRSQSGMIVHILMERRAQDEKAPA